MEDLTLYTKLVSLLFDSLVFNCPILSGNMVTHITNEAKGERESTIIVDARFYDLIEWNKSHRIKYVSGRNYALNVEKYGGFFSLNESRFWATKSVQYAVNSVASSVNAEVVYNLNNGGSEYASLFGGFDDFEVEKALFQVRLAELRRKHYRRF